VDGKPTHIVVEIKEDDKGRCFQDKKECNVSSSSPPLLLGQLRN
jgi:hypothetical protein